MIALADAAEQRAGVDAGCLPPRREAAHGRLAEVEHRAPAFLISFRAVDGEAPGPVRFGRNVLDLDGDDFGHAQQAIGRERHHGRVAQSCELAPAAGAGVPQKLQSLRETIEAAAAASR